MKRLSVSLLFACTALCLAQAQQIKSGASTGSDPETRTLRRINGHGWAIFSDDQGKMAYFLGFMDGWEAQQDLEGSVKVSEILAMGRAEKISLRNAVDLIDEGYKDPANIELPVWWVYMAEVHIKRGDMPPDKAFTALRHLLTQINASTEVLPADKWNEKFNPIDALNAAKTK